MMLNFLKKVNLKIKVENLIERKKNLKYQKSLFLHRLAYHDFYLLKKFIDLKHDVKVENYYEKKHIFHLKYQFAK